MKWLTKYRTSVIYTIALLLSMLLMYTGLTKIWEGDLFYHNIIDSPIFGGETTALVVSWLFPFLEILTAMALLWPKTRQLGLFMALGLLLIITTYIVANVYFSETIPCTCRTFFSALDWQGHLYLTLGCLVITVLAIILYQTKTKRTSTYKTRFVAQQSQE
ncbi:MauE/DoxX family redox-associated membrane protein [Sinomicrobium sp. M5D2P9]